LISSNRRSKWPQLPQLAHIVDCLDFYFREDTQAEYHWGHRFSGGWWELADEKLPIPAALLAYSAEIEARVTAHLSALDDAALSQPSPDDDAATLLGHYIYALRHTLHRHGELAALSIYHGNPGGSWA